jgi:hypothetical protein
LIAIIDTTGSVVSENQSTTITRRIAPPNDTEMGALDRHLATVKIPIAGIVEDKTGQPTTTTALQEIRKECSRLVRLNIAGGGTELSRPNCYTIILNLTGPAASVQHKAQMREYWERHTEPPPPPPLALAWRAMFEKLHCIRRNAALARLAAEEQASDTPATVPGKPSEPPANALDNPARKTSNEAHNGLRHATNDEIDRMLQEQWQQRARKPFGLSRDNQLLPNWTEALKAKGLKSQWRMVLARYNHKSNAYLHRGE